MDTRTAAQTDSVVAIQCNARPGEERARFIYQSEANRQLEAVVAAQVACLLDAMNGLPIMAEDAMSTTSV